MAAPRPHQRKIPDTAIDLIKEAQARGDSLRSVAAQLGVSAPALRKFAIAHGLHTVTPQRRIDAAQCLVLYQSGQTLAQIAETIQSDESTVSCALKRAGHPASQLLHTVPSRQRLQGQALRDHRTAYDRHRYSHDTAYRQSRLDKDHRYRESLRDFYAPLLAPFYAQGCLQCPERRPETLDAHHRDAATKLFSLSTVLTVKPTPEQLQLELAKCDCLCSNCHTKLHRIAARSELPVTPRQRYYRKMQQRNQPVLNLFQAGGCQICGNVDPDVLVAHHVDAATKTLRIAQAITTVEPAVLARELDLCACLCSNCHRMVHRAGLFCPSPRSIVWTF